MPTTLHNRHIGLKKGLADGAHKSKAGIKIPLIQIIKEQPTNPAWFVTVFQVKVFIAPSFIFRIDISAEGRAGIMGDLVPMYAVYFFGIVRGQVKTTAKPPDRLFTGLFRYKQTHIGVRGGYMWIFWVNH